MSTCERVCRSRAYVIQHVFIFLKVVETVLHTWLVEKVTWPAPRRVLKFKHMGGPVNPNSGT